MSLFNNDCDFFAKYIVKRKEAGLMENLRNGFSYRSGLRESVCEKEQCQSVGVTGVT